MDENLDWKSELLKITSILKDNGVDISNIPIRKTRDGKRYNIELKDINSQIVDIDQIIDLNKLDSNWQIGKYIKRFRSIYNQTIKGNLSDEEKKMAEELGLVQKVNSNRQKPLFTGRKISDFHINVVKENINKILSGELNNREVLAILNEEAIKVDETQIKDAGTIKRIVTIILQDKPEELKKYNDSLKHNTGRRNPYKGNIGFSGIGTYHEREKEFKQKIIDTYLPQILSGEITFRIIEQEEHVDRKTVNKIIEEYYLKINDKEGLEEYQKSKKRNSGASIETRKEAREKRQEVEEYKIVSNAEFILLSEEEQDKQIIMKIQKSKLKEEKSRGCTALTKIDTTIDMIQKTKEYFRNKNDLENKKINFSEQDIRHMIFIYPTITNRSSKNLDEKLEVLTSYDEIDNDIAYGMIKTFPAIMGYDVKRTKAQLDIFKKEKLMDYPLNKPNALMRSTGLIYALIEFAKERKGNDLKDVNRSNIFMANSTLKRLYGTTYEELKERFPYDISKVEQDIPYSITGEDIGKATYKSVNIEQSNQASEIINNLVFQKESKKRGRE